MSTAVSASARGHGFALATVLIWGVTFVSTKVLLEGCAPIEILLFRFALGYGALWIIRPRLLRVEGWRDELLFVAAGACGVALYFLLENIALVYTTASNVGVIVAVAPLFTGLIASLLLKEGKLGRRFFVGFALAIGGIALISFAGSGVGPTDTGASAANVAGVGVATEAHMTTATGAQAATAATVAAAGPQALTAAAVGVPAVTTPAGAPLSDAMMTSLFGSLLALLAAIVWAVYSNLSKRISARGFGTVLATRRTFFWGLVFMLPCLPLFGFSPDWAFIFTPLVISNLAFLGFGASALCYVMWNTAVRELGPVKTTVYIYLVPVVTIVTSIIVLGEPLTVAIAVGALMTIAGLLISELKPRKSRTVTELPIDTSDNHSTG